jgi:hypothetical protein
MGRRNGRNESPFTWGEEWMVVAASVSGPAGRGLGRVAVASGGRSACASRRSLADTSGLGALRGVARGLGAGG